MPELLCKGPVQWHQLTAQDAAEHLGSDESLGLSKAEAADRLEQWGLNQVPEVKDRPVWRILFDQFCNLVVGLLLVAVVLAFLAGDHAEAVAIVVVIGINAVIGFLTEWQSVRAIALLREEMVPTAVVCRDGLNVTIPASHLVPGDLVKLQAGCRVPADGRLVVAERLALVESLLTGEPAAVCKTGEALSEPNLMVADRINMAYMGTWVTAGRGLLLVTATGPRTEVGSIGRLLQETSLQRTPLEFELDRLSRLLVALVLLLCLVIVLMGLWCGHKLYPMLEVGVSLAIAAVPESLPAIATLTLALGVRKMARLKTLVRRLPAVEALGATTLICTDKTGTLTRNHMTVQHFWLGGRLIEVSGVETNGAADLQETGLWQFSDDGQPVDWRDDSQLETILRVGLLCNDSHLEPANNAVNSARMVGDPTEVALLQAAAGAGLDQSAEQARWPRVAEVPFNHGNMIMETMHRGPGNQILLCAKGAPRAILDRCSCWWKPEGLCTLTDADRSWVLAENEKLAASGGRVLALADLETQRNLQIQDGGLGPDEPLRFIGLVVMQDPVRPGVVEAVAMCRRAGIRTVMMTGDQPATAAAVARKVGLGHLSVGACHVIHGQALGHGEPLTEINHQICRADVFARVSPEQKLQIVEALQAHGHVVTMTGDGVNDAPALRRANVGVAMGGRGADIAREAASLIITDDNFATIVKAVEQGRTIYENITKSILYLMSCNFGEVLIVSVAIVLGWPLPLLPLQILWMNLVTDVFPALALAVEPAAPDVMDRPPRDLGSPMFGTALVWTMVWQGTLIASSSLLVYQFGLRVYGQEGTGLARAQTLCFSVASLSQIVHSFNIRSRYRSVFGPGLWKNQWLWAGTCVCVVLQLLTVLFGPLRVLLGTADLDSVAVAVVVAASLVPLLVMELVKWGERCRTSV